LFEGGFEVFDDLLGENVGSERLQIFRTFVYEPEDVEAGLVAIMRLIKSKKVLRSELPRRSLASLFQRKATKAH
jgi:hypothetical protein